MNVTRAFEMDESPERSQERFLRELLPALHRSGFAVRDQAPGVVILRPRMMGTLVSPAGAVALRLWRAATGQSLSIEFEPAGDGTRVCVSGCTPAAFAAQVQLLGRVGHWPETLEDDFWLPGLPKAEAFNAQDSVPFDDEDESQMDRITRRARAKDRKLAAKS